ncbi:MAG: hypothetical protein ACJ764_14610 [Solirubrobacteraceae bacterium]
MRWAQINGQGTSAQLVAYGNDEKGLLLGVNGATPLASAPTNGSNGQPGGTSHHATNASGGSPTATDPSGRVYYPALYITNVTAHPLSGGTGVGDFQNGGTPRNLSGGQPFIDDVFGAWSTATVSGANYTVTPPASKNDWNLGTGSDAPVGTTFAAMGDEGYGTEVRWNAGNLTDSDGHALQPGNTYRIQVLEHDGDQNKTGGDAGEFCVQLKIPGSPGIKVVKTQRIDSTGSFTHNPVFGKIGDTVNYRMTVTNTGTISESYTFSDPQCDAGTLVAPAPPGNTTLTAGQSVVWTCSHILNASDKASGFTNAACAATGALQSCDTVIAHVPAITLVKVQRIGSSGSFTHNDVTGGVGDTDNYQMKVTNTGDTSLVLDFTDANCDGGTLSGPSPALVNNTLAKGASVLYTCSHVLAAGDQPYVNTANVTGTAPNGQKVSAHDSVRAFANTPGIQVVKLQRNGTSGTFTHDPITASVGDTIYYEIQVTNTGNVPLTLSLSDPHCDAGTIQGPISISGSLNGSTLAAGGVAQYTCWHVAQVGDIPQYTNTAVVTGQPPTGPPVHGTDIVVANITQPGIQVLKLERDANSGGSFTTGPITVNVGRPGHYILHTIEYEIQVTNTGSEPLKLTLDDPHCDAGTIQGPAVITGTLSGNVLSPGGEAQYTCSHNLVKSDPARFTNTATVIGKPPTGPPVSGTSSVTVKKHSQPQAKKVCRTPSGRLIHYRGHRKPKACHKRRQPPPRPPRHPRGFTG